MISKQKDTYEKLNLTKSMLSRFTASKFSQQVVLGIFSWIRMRFFGGLNVLQKRQKASKLL